MSPMTGLYIPPKTIYSTQKYYNISVTRMKSGSDSTPKNYFHEVQGSKCRCRRSTPSTDRPHVGAFNRQRAKCPRSTPSMQDCKCTHQPMG